MDERGAGQEQVWETEGGRTTVRPPSHEDSGPSGINEGRAELQDTVERTREYVREHAARRPYALLGAAAAAGYILAAGIPGPVLAFLLRSGIRSGLSSVARSMMSTLVEEVRPSR